jgi:hypothetical protein
MITASFYLPRFIQVAKAVTVDEYIKEDGAVASMASAKYNLYDENSNLIVDGAAATLNPLTGNLSYAIPLSVLPDTLTLSEDWLEEWVVTMTDGRIETIRREASLVLRLLYALVTDADLLERHSDLNNMLPEGVTNWQKYIVAAWKKINAKLLTGGKRPYLILSSWALRELHVCMTLELIFTDLMTYSAGGPGKYSDLATKYQRCVKAEWDGMQLTYDYGETGVPADAIDAPTEPVVYLKGI